MVAVALSEFNSAARMREIIRQYAAEIVDEMYPRPRYATVVSVNEPARACNIQYPDEAVNFQVPYGDVIPAVGSIVRVIGQPGAKYIESVVSRGQAVPAGLIADYVGTTAPPGWDLIQGNTIVNAQTLRPDLWAAAPVAWRSGANIIMPDHRGRVSVGYSGAGLFTPIGGLGGSANSSMPDHQHWNGDHTHTMADHTHTHDHTHAVGTGNESVGHEHGANVGSGELMARDTAYNTGYHGPIVGDGGLGGGVAITWGATGGINRNHTHGGSTGLTSSGTYTGYYVATHGGGLNDTWMIATHGGNVATSTVIGGATTTNTNYQPYIAFTKIIKL